SPGGRSYARSPSRADGSRRGRTWPLPRGRPPPTGTSTSTPLSGGVVDAIAAPGHLASVSCQKWHELAGCTTKHIVASVARFWRPTARQEARADASRAHDRSPAAGVGSGESARHRAGGTAGTHDPALGPRVLRSPDRHDPYLRNGCGAQLAAPL